MTAAAVADMVRFAHLSRPCQIEMWGPWMNRTVLTAVVLLTAMFGASAAGQPSPNQPDMPVDVSMIANTITSLAKGLRSAYVFPAVGEKVATMLEQRQTRGEYGSVSSAKAFSELVTRQMFEVTRDKHLRML